MNRHITNVVGILFTAAGLVLMGAGCSSTPKVAKGKPANISITKTTPASIEVDIVGVMPLEKPTFKGKSIDDYWKTGDTLRRGLVEGRDRLSVQLKMGEPWTLDRKDELWKTWMSRGVNELLIIANLPGSFEAGPADPRRVFVPLDGRWKGKAIEIEVREAQIIFLTPRK